MDGVVCAPVAGLDLLTGNDGVTVAETRIAAAKKPVSGNVFLHDTDLAFHIIGERFSGRHGVAADVEVERAVCRSSLHEDIGGSVLIAGGRQQRSFIDDITMLGQGHWGSFWRSESRNEAVGLAAY